MNLSTAPVSANDIQMDYMKLLVTQLQNQNPLEPLDNSEMASQLAQLSQLGQIESLNSRFAEVLATMERSYASSLGGKEVSFVAQTPTGDTQIVSGAVAEVFTDLGDEVRLRVGDYIVSLEEVMSVKS